MGLIGHHPLLLGAQARSGAGLAGVGEVESVPDLAAGVDGVAEHRADRGPGPVATTVAAGIDVAGSRRATRSIEMVGNCLWAPAARSVEVEDLGDDQRLVRVRGEGDAGLAGVAPVALGHGVELPSVAVRRASTGSEALFGRLAHSALGLSGEFVPLELVPQLLHADEQRALGCVGVTGAGGVVDRHPDFAQLALIERGDEPVTSKAAGRVDDYRIEPAGVAVAGFVRQRAPAGAVLLRA